METEIPAMLRAREAMEPERFTFHSSRMRMKKVTKEELAAMDADSDRCAAELSDARVDVIGYACLVAIMSMGQGYHRASQKRLQEVTQRESGGCIPVVTSAGALVDSLHALGARRIAMVAPYVETLTCMVADYIEAEDDQGRRSHRARNSRQPRGWPARSAGARATIYKDLRLGDVDVLVLSSCVQMPSLAAVPIVEQECGLPVISASIATTYQMLKRLGTQDGRTRRGCVAVRALLARLLCRYFDAFWSWRLW